MLDCERSVTPGVHVSHNERQPVALEHQRDKGAGCIIVTSQGPGRCRRLWHRSKPRMAGDREAREQQR